MTVVSWSTSALSSMCGTSKSSLLGHALIGTTSLMSICLEHGYIMASTPSMTACLSYPGGYKGPIDSFHSLATV